MRPRLRPSAFQGIWGHPEPSHGSCPKFHPPQSGQSGREQPQSSITPTPPGPIPAGAGIGSGTKVQKSPGASGLSSSPREYPPKKSQENPSFPTSHVLVARGEHPTDGLGCKFPLWTPFIGLFPTPGMPGNAFLKKERGSRKGKLLGKPNLGFNSIFSHWVLEYVCWSQGK